MLWVDIAANANKIVKVNSYIMKISTDTLTILKNFNGLNPNLVVKPGNIIKTIAKEGSATLAIASIAENFEIPFAVGNLSKFIGAVSLFENPDFEFFDNYVKISEGTNYVRYVYDEPSLLDAPPDGQVKMETRDVEFELSEKDFSLIMKAASNLQSPQLCLTGEDNTIYFRAVDIKNPTSSNFSMAVGITDQTFNSSFNALNFKFLSRNYNVTLCTDKIIEFKSENLTYWMAARIE